MVYTFTQSLNAWIVAIFLFRYAYSFHKSIHIDYMLTCKCSCLQKRLRWPIHTHAYSCNLVCSYLFFPLLLLLLLFVSHFAWPQVNAFIKCWHFCVTQYMLWMEFYNWRCYYYPSQISTDKKVCVHVHFSLNIIHKSRWSMQWWFKWSPSSSSFIVMRDAIVHSKLKCESIDFMIIVYPDF